MSVCFDLSKVLCVQVFSVFSKLMPVNFLRWGFKETSTSSIMPLFMFMAQQNVSHGHENVAGSQKVQISSPLLITCKRTT